MRVVVGIGQYAVSNDETDIIKTYALASCVAVTAYSPAKKAGGMIHVALPYPMSRAEGHPRPGCYATTGIPLLIDKLCRELKCHKGELKIQIFGGADSINTKDAFNIGQRNIEAVTKTLAELNLKIDKAEVGGTNSRTIEMDMNTGDVKVSLQPIII